MASSEFALLVACAGWPPSARRVAAVRAAAGTTTTGTAIGSAAIDWNRFERLVARHRMAGMAVNGLTAAEVPIPDGAADRLRAAARRDLLQALATAKEAVRLAGLLADAGINMVVLKGPPLAALVYGTQAVRQVRDLDLLVDPAALPRALDLLRGEGYALHYEGGDEGLRPDRSAVMKDVTLVHPGGLLVELHARLAENPALLPVDAVAGGVRPVSLAPGLDVPALTGDPLLLYLTVHGFRHGWYRLKWLADVAAIVATMDVPALAAFVATARGRGLYVVVASTLLVLADVMGATLPPALLDPARRDPRARWCARVARRWLGDEREVDQHAAHEVVTVAMLFLASSRPAYLARELARLFIDKDFAIRFGGGRDVVALSVALRPVLWPARKLGALVQRRWHR